MSTTTETPTFGSELRRLRKARGLSQRQLVDATEYDHTTISRLEAGTRNPSRSAVGLLSDALHLNRAEEFRLYFAAGYVPAFVIGMSLDDLVGVLERAAT